MLKVNWQTRVVYTQQKKIGHVNQIWVTSVSPNIYIYIYIYIIYIYIYYIYIVLYIYIIGPSLSEPHTNRYYEKIAIGMYVCVCVSAIRRPRVVLVHVRVVNLSLGRTRAPILTATFNVDDHFHLEVIVKINVIILERVLVDI